MTGSASPARRSLLARQTPTLLLSVASLAACVPSNAAQELSVFLDLRDFDETFNDSFRTLSISASGSDTTWSAHTPWHGDFGDAKFEDLGPGTPFSLDPQGGLRITATRDGAGRWHSGLISSRGSDGPDATGFAQKYGYFEFRARLPAGQGTWPAFWLIGTQKREGGSEIDIVEFYGGFPRFYHNMMHFFKSGTDNLHEDHLVRVPSGQVALQFNDYGVLIEENETSFYFNRMQVWRRPTPPSYHQSFYILADLAIGGGWNHDALASPAIMVIQRISVFARRPPRPNAIDPPP